MSKYEGVICRGSYLLGSACGHCEKCKDEMESLRQSGKLPEMKPQNFPKANAYSLLAEVRADLQKLESFQSVHALEENAYIKAIQDAIDIIDKKVSERLR